MRHCSVSSPHRHPQIATASFSTAATRAIPAPLRSSAAGPHPSLARHLKRAQSARPVPLPAPTPLQVAADSKFADLGADSLDTVEIMMALEEKVSKQPASTLAD